MSEKPKTEAAGNDEGHNASVDLNALFELDKLPEPKLDVSHLTRKDGETKAPRSGASTNFLNLEGKRKVLFVVGAGNTGKTVFLRWACQKPQHPWALLTLDTVNRELVHYFDRVATPPDGVNGTEYLSRVLETLMQGEMSAAIDFGAGDVTLPSLAQEVPNLAQLLKGAGLEPVLILLLSPRVSDLTALIALDECGFTPAATCLVLNLGRADGAEAFRGVREHSAYRRALARQGTAEIWMPRLYSAGPAIESARLSFAAAMGETSPLTLFNRSRVWRWLQAMDSAFAPVRSWLP